MFFRLGSSMPSVFMIIFIVVLVYIISKGISTHAKNDKSPIVATNAVLVDKKADISTNTDANGAMNTNETLLLYFKLDTGSTMRFTVGGRVYHSVAYDEWGTLTFQGTRFLKFESPSGSVER